jgi:proteasome lid subunit RPN8/RPN11
MERPEFMGQEPQILRPPGRLRRLLVPSSILHSSIQGLRAFIPAEGLCYWYGREVEPDVGLIMVTAFPKIDSTEQSFELLPGQMSELTNWSQREDLWLLAQVHTHPTDEPHSSADQEWSASHREGFLSVVIPFGGQFSTLRSPGWRLFECDARGRWESASRELIRVFDDVRLPES